MSQRIYITGATGYLGGALAKRLVQRHSVTALVRSESDPTRVADLESAGVVTSLGDVTDRFSLRSGMSGSDWVIHAAACVDMDAPEQVMQAANVEGSENVASLAYKLGVPRFLSVSSMAYWGGSPADGSLATEDSPVYEFPTTYSATKHAGERAVRVWSERGLRTYTVFPSLIYGPPGKRSGTNALLRMALKGRMPFLVGARRKLSWVVLDDVVDAVLRIMERADQGVIEPGRGYLLAGDVATLGDTVRRACELADVRPPRLSIPVPPAKGMLRIWSALGGLLGSRPPATPDRLRNLERHWAFDDSRARRELDWHPRGLAEGLPPTVAMLTRG